MNVLILQMKLSARKKCRKTRSVIWSILKKKWGKERSIHAGSWKVQESTGSGVCITCLAENWVIVIMGWWIILSVIVMKFRKNVAFLFCCLYAWWIILNIQNWMPGFWKSWKRWKTEISAKRQSSMSILLSTRLLRMIEVQNRWNIIWHGLWIWMMHCRNRCGAMTEQRIIKWRLQTFRSISWRPISL